MKDQVLYYWDLALKEEHQEPNVNDYIIHCSVVNTYFNTYENNWRCCDSIEKLIGYVKYVALPSIQLSRSLIKNKDLECVYFDTADQLETRDILRNTSTDAKLINEYNEWFDRLDGSNCNTLDDLKEIIDDLNNRIEFKDGFVYTLEVYENVKELGKNLISSYEEMDIVDLLEEEFHFKIDQIRNIFDNYEKNAFLKKRIMDILYNLSPI